MLLCKILILLQKTAEVSGRDFFKENYPTSFGNICE